MKSSRAMATGLVVETVSPTELYDVVVGACSQDPVLVQESSQRLKEMVDMLGTYDALQEIAAQRSVPLAVRQQAIIQFKNSALSHWKSRKVLTDDQRSRIRIRCLSFLDETDETIAECNEIVVSKISRQDYPHNWPTLLVDLLNLIDDKLKLRQSSLEDDPQNVLILRRSIKLLNGILKEFASIKMLSGIKIMTTMVEQLRSILQNYYAGLTAHLNNNSVTHQNIATQRIRNDILLAHLVFKCVVKTTEWSWNRLDKVSKEEFETNQDWINNLFRNSALHLKNLAELRKHIVISLIQNGLHNTNFPHESLDILTRHVLLFGKFFRRLQKLSPIRFVALPSCGDIVLYYWSQVDEATNGPAQLVADSKEAVYPLRFLVQGMVLFKDNLAKWTPVRKDGTPNESSLSKEFVENAVRLLITRFMPLNELDLENWMNDPEEWVNLEDKENEQWDFEIRPCSERVLVQLSNQFSDYVTPLLQTTFKDIAPQSVVELPGVLQKEALYCAIGRCAHRLKGFIPFEEWLQHTILSEVREANPSFPIIKRRIAWMVGKWVSEDCTSPNSPVIWEILMHLLKDRGPGTDTVVRLTAAAALRECVDSVHLNTNILEPFLATAVTELVRLIGEAETLESKRRVDNSLNVLIEQAGTQITPYITTITEPLPRLWVAAGEDWLFKASLLVTVTKLIGSVKEHSTVLGGIVVPLVRESLQPGVIINLDEDGLNLWLAALRNTVSISSVDGAPALLDLFPLAMAMLSTNLDLLGKIINILESYFLLDASGILQNFAVNLFTSFLAALKSGAVSSNLKEMLTAIGLLVQISPSTNWAEPLHNSGLFAHLLLTLVEGEASVIFLTEIIYLFSRIVMADRYIFVQLISATAASVGKEESYLYDNVLDQWWGKFDNMSEPRFRKLTAMGIASFVSTGRPEVLQRLPGEIFNLWLDVFGEIKEAHVETIADADDDPSFSSLKRYWELDEAPSSYYQDTDGTVEYNRRKAVYEQDPIRNIPLNVYVRSRIGEVEAMSGPENFQVYLSKADPTVLKQIQDELVRSQ